MYMKLELHENPGQIRNKRNRLQDLKIAPRGLSRTDAAGYIGVSPSLFDEMVKDGRMPLPKRINSRSVWDLHQLDQAFDALPDGNNALTEDWKVAV